MTDPLFGFLDFPRRHNPQTWLQSGETGTPFPLLGTLPACPVSVLTPPQAAALYPLRTFCRHGEAHPSSEPAAPPGASFLPMYSFQFHIKPPLSPGANSWKEPQNSFLLPSLGQPWYPLQGKFIFYLNSSSQLRRSHFVAGCGCVLLMGRGRCGWGPTVNNSPSFLVVSSMRSLSLCTGLPDGSAGKESACNAGDLDSIPGFGTATHSSILTWRIPWTV